MLVDDNYTPKLVEVRLRELGLANKLEIWRWIADPDFLMSRGLAPIFRRKEDDVLDIFVKASMRPGHFTVRWSMCDEGGDFMLRWWHRGFGYKPHPNINQISLRDTVLLVLLK
jgi:hypothetical protein